MTLVPIFVYQTTCIVYMTVIIILLLQETNTRQPKKGIKIDTHWDNIQLNNKYNDNNVNFWSKWWVPFKYNQHISSHYFSSLLTKLRITSSLELTSFDSARIFCSSRKISSSLSSTLRSFALTSISSCMTWSIFTPRSRAVFWRITVSFCCCEKEIIYDIVLEYIWANVWVRTNYKMVLNSIIYIYLKLLKIFT